MREQECHHAELKLPEMVNVWLDLELRICRRVIRYCPRADGRLPVYDLEIAKPDEPVSGGRMVWWHAA